MAQALLARMEEGRRPKADERLGPEQAAGRATATPLDVWVADREGHFRGDAPEPALAAELAPIAVRIAAAGASETLDLELAADGGKKRALRIRGRPLPDGDVALAVLDLTGLRAVEKALSRYDLVFRATKDAVWEWNVITNEAWWNRRLYEMYGLDPSTTTPSYEAWAERIHHDDRERVLHEFAQAVTAKATTWVDEYRTVLSDGSIGTMLDRGYIERDEAGQPLRMIGVMSDVTENRTATAALEASDERFRQLTEAIDEVFWLTNADGSKMLYISPAYERIWGRTCESLYEQPKSFVNAIHEHDRERIAEQVRTQRDVGFDLTYRIRRPDGKICWIRDRAFPVKNENGEVIRIAGVAEDKTIERSLEEQLVQSQKMESVGRLAGGVAHDFNNLLTVILAGTRFAMRRVEDPQARDDLLRIQDAAERAARLTSQLLAFARRQVIAPIRLDLNELATDIDGLLRRVMGENIELTTALGRNLGVVMADASHIEQVIVNLVINARDAMPHGGRLTIETANVTIDRAYTAVHPDVTEGEYVMLAVSDTGIGMSPEVKEHIFEPFFTTKPAGQGTGLGLATCYGIVRQVGGHILVYTEPGRGTTFKILLPRVRTGEDSAEPVREELRLGGTETVLFVEDHSAVREIGVRILEEQGYRVLAASGGTEALSIANAHVGLIHLLVSDVVMPHMSGTELDQRLREHRPELRVLFTSGYAENAIATHDVLAPNVAFLPKPYVAETLLGKVREVLDRDG